jgi:hypothetical protein
MVTNVDQFMGRLGVPDGSWEIRPAMVPQTIVRVTAGHEPQLRSALKGLTVAGEPVLYSEREDGFFSISLGHENVHNLPDCVVLHGSPVRLEEAGLTCKTIDDKCGSTAYHVPIGSMLIYDPRMSPAAGKPRRQISTVDLAPQLLVNFGIEPPAYMRGRCFL